MRLLCFDAGKSHLFMMEYLVKGKRLRVYTIVL